MTALLVVGILVFLIVIHELGHFAAAKIFKVKVEEFGVGYPPRAFFLGTWGGTEYTLNWIPFGGFVRLLGENNDAGSRVKGSFAAAPRYIQALILVAGVFMNAVAAWFLFAGALTAGIPHVVPSGEKSESAYVLTSTVLPSSPASVAGLIAGDRILSVTDDEKKEAQLSPEGIVAFVGERGGEDLTVRISRGAEELTLLMRPAHAVVESAASRPALGIGLVMVTDESVPFHKALITAFPITVDKLMAVLESIGGMITNAFRGAPVLKDVVGPVGLVSVVGDAAEHGFGSVLILAGFISLNLAVVNLIPVPALDGGRLVLLGFEGLMRKNAPQLAVRVLNALGIGLIALLMISVTYQDIARLIG